MREKQIKLTEDQGEKLIKAIENRVKKNILDADLKSRAYFFLRG